MEVNMKFVVQINKNDIAVCKLINHIGTIFDNEVEITEEQYNEINEFPLKLTIEGRKVVSWEKTTIEYPPAEEPPQESTVEDYLIDLDFRVSKIELGLEV